MSALAGLIISCIHCNKVTDEFPGEGTDEIDHTKTVCRVCLATTFRPHRR